VNILDENIIASQRQLLRSWRIRVRQIGYDLAQKGISDEQIIPFLRVLHHGKVDTQAKRMGTVIRVSHQGLRIWRLNADEEQSLDW
jgi:hypothetical protein